MQKVADLSVRLVAIFYFVALPRHEEQAGYCLEGGGHMPLPSGRFSVFRGEGVSFYHTVLFSGLG